MLDGVRASAIFHSLEALNSAVARLTEDGCEIKVVRCKDRFSKPLASGYVDALLNVKIEGVEMIVELQLHLEDVISLKEEAHKIYDLMRAAGWDGVSILPTQPPWVFLA